MMAVSPWCTAQLHRSAARRRAGLAEGTLHSCHQENGATRRAATAAALGQRRQAANARLPRAARDAGLQLWRRDEPRDDLSGASAAVFFSAGVSELCGGRTSSIGPLIGCGSFRHSAVPRCHGGGGAHLHSSRR